MSKILRATCAPGKIVTADGFPVTDAQVLTEGMAQSSGLLIMDEDRADYLTSSSSDVKALIVNLKAIVDQIITIATGLDAVTTSPGSNAAGIAALMVLNTQLNLTKDLLK